MVLGLAGRARRKRLAFESHTVNPFSFQPFASSLVVFVGLATAVIACAACDEPDTPGRQRAGAEAPAPIASLAGLLGVDAGELEGRVDPPAPAGDLKAEIERFTTVDTCVEERARLDPVLGDALEAIGYDTFLRDACRVMDATKANDASRCDAIDSSALATRCRATVAEVAGNPDACPWEIADRPARGRVPRCVAVATRDPRLCAAVTDELERATCEATLAQSEASCLKLRGHGPRARCTRDAARWRTVILAGAADSGAEPLVIAGALHVTRADVLDAATTAAGTLDVNLTPDLERGVTLVEERDGTRLVIGPLAETGLDFIAPSPHVRASLALEVTVPSGPSMLEGAGARVSARIERVELLLPGRPPMTTPGAHSTLVAKVDRLVRARGGAVKVVLDGDLDAAGSSWHLHAEEATFVRDIVRSRDVYGGISRLGADGGMH